MDHELYSIRPFEVADYEAQARIEREFVPELPFTAAELRRWTEAHAAVPGHLSEKVVVEHRPSGDVVAHGALYQTTHSFHPQKFRIAVAVSRPHRGRGIGTELYTRLEQEARSRAARCLWVNVREDDLPSVRFLAQHGFTVEGRTWESWLDLGTADLTNFPDRTDQLRARGLRFTTAAEEGLDRPEVRAGLHRLHVVSAADVPRLGEYTPHPFEVFAANHLDAPGVLPEAIFLAAFGTEYVGMSSLQRSTAQPDTLGVAYTGTDPRFRRIGLASELKRRTVEYGRSHRYRFLVTGNDAENGPMWAINERLGFRREITWVQGEKRFGTSTPEHPAGDRPTAV
ncbi:MAG: GNAT family N-acetyltransferase [Thermoplasmata archaeon]